MSSNYSEIPSPSTASRPKRNFSAKHIVVTMLVTAILVVGITQALVSHSVTLSSVTESARAATDYIKSYLPGTTTSTTTHTATTTMNVNGAAPLPVMPGTMMRSATPNGAMPLPAMPGTMMRSAMPNAGMQYTGMSQATGRMYNAPVQGVAPSSMRSAGFPQVSNAMSSTGGVRSAASGFQMFGRPVTGMTSVGYAPAAAAPTNREAAAFPVNPMFNGMRAQSVPNMQGSFARSAPVQNVQPSSVRAAPQQMPFAAPAAQPVVNA